MAGREVVLVFDFLRHRIHTDPVYRPALIKCNTLICQVALSSTPLRADALRLLRREMENAYDRWKALQGG